MGKPGKEHCQKEQEGIQGKKRKPDITEKKCNSIATIFCTEIFDRHKIDTW